jgi:quinol monooxygenase YgiN
MYQIIARWRALPGKHVEVLTLIKEMVTETRKEAGNHRYHVYQSLEDPHSFLLDELYTSAAAAQVHRDSEHFQRIVQGKISALLKERSSEKREVTEP